MEDLVIIGARGFGREIYDLAAVCAGFGKAVRVKGFLDDKVSALDGFPHYPPILDSAEDYTIGSDDVFVCALGSVAMKKKYIDLMLNKGAKFTSLIDPTARIGSNVKIGRGVIVGNHATLSSDCEVGNFTSISSNVVLGHDSSIGEYCHVGSFSFFGGFSIVEEQVTVHPRASVLPRVNIGKKATVGAASLVIKNVKEGQTVFGVPATILRS